MGLAHPAESLAVQILSGSPQGSSAEHWERVPRRRLPDKFGCVVRYRDDNRPVSEIVPPELQSNDFEVRLLWARLDRAQEHCRSFGQIWSEYLSQRPHRLEQKIEQGETVVVTLMPATPLPAELSVVDPLWTRKVDNRTITRTQDTTQADALRSSRSQTTRPSPTPDRPIRART